MKKFFGVAAVLGSLAAGVLASPAMAIGPCDTGVLIDWDADGFAYETAYTPATFNSALGSQLTCVGHVSLFCTPFDDLEANILINAKEYTFIFKNLVSAGTVVSGGGGFNQYDTDYTGGVFEIWEDTYGDAPRASTPMPPNPPNASVPSKFINGTKILEGTISDFHTEITSFMGSANGSFRANWLFTGGTLYNRVAALGPNLMQGVWVVTPSSLPTGYSAHPDGKFDAPSTPARSSTWGTIKSLYR
ncbi:MAG: hypothetical protein A2W00_02000 [Candidatus Eisenbacteria bacterium RBG_16_71_46]|nr:MAG: hypothetical protein A2W00_02000 [Candidatus Eisenbacteria bacterium RBG_16_71_46]